MKSTLERIRELKELCLDSLKDSEKDFKQALYDFTIIEDFIIDSLKVKDRLNHILNDITYDIERLKGDLSW